MSVIKHSKQRQRGMSVIEIMIAISISIVVVLGMERIFVASLRANADAISYTNLNSQMRATMQVMSRDLRRTGFWAGSLGDIGSGSQNNPFILFTAVDLDGDVSNGSECIIYGYDLDEDGDPSDTNEWRAFRYNSTDQTVEVLVAGNGPGVADCTESDGKQWESFVDGDAIAITRLNFVVTERPVEVDDSLCPDQNDALFIVVRTVDIFMEGELESDSNVSRDLNESVRIRNDELRTVPLVPAQC